MQRTRRWSRRAAEPHAPAGRRGLQRQHRFCGPCSAIVAGTAAGRQEQAAPLILPRTPPAPPNLVPSTAGNPVSATGDHGARAKLAEVIAEIGIDATLALLADTERAAA
jgi:hypothetical protein